MRNNTLKIAEEIPEDKYSFRPAEGTRTVAQTLIHISNVHRFALAINRDQVRSTMEGFDFMAFIGPMIASEQEPMTKAQIIARLTATGEEYENWLRTLSDDFLGQSVTMPPGGTPPSRTRFDMLLSVKEHEMHHRGQLNAGGADDRDYTAYDPRAGKLAEAVDDGGCRSGEELRRDRSCRTGATACVVTATSQSVA